ncbi:hypothetical protein GCM10010358_80390 [Streptomyces minutiscleroticus]|uniref:Uncharacterized protein n=1 Tax=Streptomyces minutiscleroticus TaxID=68238 RepID=A0A918UA16_9ACTN|nr:hypothetical protein GCM10010358_80390 [Streptomyces minutiscleroticus]
MEVADRDHHGDRGHRVHARNGHQSPHYRIVERLGGQAPFHRGKFRTVEVELAQQRRDRLPFVGRQRLVVEPVPPADAEQIVDRRTWQHIAMQHRLDLILDPNAAAHQLRPVRRQAPQHPGALVRQPRARQEVGGQQLRENARVDPVGLHFRLGDRPGLDRVGDHHPRDMRLEEHGHCARVSGCLQRHVVVRAQLCSELSQCFWPAPHPAPICDASVLDHRDLREIAVNVQSDEPPHHPSPVRTRTWYGDQLGETTPTESRSRRSQASRGGGRLQRRARSPSFKIDLPMPIPRAPLVLTVAPYNQTEAR